MKGWIIAAAGVVFAILIAVAGAYLISGGESIVSGNRVAVVSISGVIAMESESGLFAEGATTPEDVKTQIEHALDDDSVKAILLEVNSPGGSAVASDEIAEIIKDARKKKPVVAWLGEWATSGAYYVASAADYIVASPATVTGSVGVIFILPEYSGLMRKVGVNMTVIKAGEYKDFARGYRPLSREEEEMLQSVVDEIYDVFVREVAENRNLSEEYVRERVASGGVFSAAQARELGLVDEIGTRSRALEKAGELGGIEGKPEEVRYRRKTLFSELFTSAMQNIGYGFAKGMAEVYSLYGEVRAAE